jgi:hypothetical protein
MLMQIKPDPYTGEILTQSQSSESKYLNSEITLTDSAHKGGKVFARFVVEGRKVQQFTIDILGSIARSAMGVNANDRSKETEAKLGNFQWEDLNGARFIGKTGKIEKGKLKDPTQGPNGERYDDKATLACGVTPDMKEEWTPWKDAPRGFGLNDSLNGVMRPPLVEPDIDVDEPPWGDHGDDKP